MCFLYATDSRANGPELLHFLTQTTISNTPITIKIPTSSIQMASATVPCEERPDVETGHVGGEVVTTVVVVVMVTVTAGTGKG